MVLAPRAPSALNVMLGRQTNALSKETKQTTLSFGPAKRRKLTHPSEHKNLVTNDAAPRDIRQSPIHDKHTHIPPSKLPSVIPDSDAENNDEEEGLEDHQTETNQTNLEQALPPIKTDKEAIEEYEAIRRAEDDERTQRLDDGEWVRGKSSIYVDAFNLALDTVLEEESHLFNAAEMQVFRDWRRLDYEAQYLYVRLFLRKTSTWFRLNSLGHYRDVTDMDKASDTLFAKRSLPQCSEEEQDIPGELQAPEGMTLTDEYTFAEGSEGHIDSLEEASSLLKLDELKALAKEAKVQGKNKNELLRNFRRTSGRQTALGFNDLKRSESEESARSATPGCRDESPEKRDAQMFDNRDAYFTNKILTATGSCIRLSLATCKLFERVHLVFYRSTEWTEKSLTTIILARITRRNFPPYVVSRSANIFSSRSMLLEFEASLRVQFRIDSILEFNGTPTKDKLQVILDIFEEVLPRWRCLLSEEQQKEDSIYASGEGAYLRRLSPAWVYTRIVHKGAYVLGLGKFKDHAREHAVLSELLEQRLFHHARRGAWYQRKALLEEHYMHELSPLQGVTLGDQKKEWKRIALSTCEGGLQDNLTHVIHHYDLQKRLSKLERQLKVPKRSQHDFGHTRLAKPAERTFDGVQIQKSHLPPKPQGVPRLVHESSNVGSASNRPGKTIWVNPDEEAGKEEPEISVEEMCLSNYRRLGWNGYHAEGGVLRTLFALLFYDILFVYVPNVFQTPYQTCPLDLHTDAFYPTRLSEINARLAEIGNGAAPRIVSEVWEKEEEKKTCVVGLRWDAFTCDELVKICQCFDAGGLSIVMKVLAQEYAQRGGGVPDLFMWRTESEDKDRFGEVMFAEVKSENDRLSDTQRLWIDVLTGAGVGVELCHAVAREVKMKD